jgi:hypothetical protein
MSTLTRSAGQCACAAQGAASAQTAAPIAIPRFQIDRMFHPSLARQEVSLASYKRSRAAIGVTPGKKRRA